jgi:hypothetical protein
MDDKKDSGGYIDQEREEEPQDEATGSEDFRRRQLGLRTTPRARMFRRTFDMSRNSKRMSR